MGLVGVGSGEPALKRQRIGTEEGHVGVDAAERLDRQGADGGHRLGAHPATEAHDRDPALHQGREHRDGVRINDEVRVGGQQLGEPQRGRARVEKQRAAAGYEAHSMLRDGEFLLGLFGARGDARFLTQALDRNGATVYPTQQPAGLELGHVFADALGADTEMPC